jgi:hypothetical protein
MEILTRRIGRSKTSPRRYAAKLQAERRRGKKDGMAKRLVHPDQLELGASYRVIVRQGQ